MSELQEAFREAARREFAWIPEENEIDWTFTPRFHRKMRRILRAQAHGYWHLVNTTAKRVACAVAILALLLTTAMAIKPVRERVIRFFVEVYEEFWEVRFGEETEGDIQRTEEPMTRYTISPLPEGYYETKYLDLDVYLWTEWQHENGNEFFLQQELGTNSVTLDGRFINSTEITHNGIVILWSEGEEVDYYLWNHDGYVFLLGTYGEFTQEEQFALIDNLVIFDQ